MSAPEPAYIEYTFAVQTGVKQVECINLLAQAMLAYADMSDTERAAVAAWFGKTYGGDSARSP